MNWHDRFLICGRHGLINSKWLKDREPVSVPTTLDNRLPVVEPTILGNRS